MCSPEKQKKIANLILADKIMQGFNAYFLLGVLHEALVSEIEDDEIDEFVHVINMHHEHGIGSITIDANMMKHSTILDNLLTDEIVRLYNIYKHAVFELEDIYGIDTEEILDCYDLMVEMPADKLTLMDYMQSQRWFNVAINFHRGLKAYHKIYDQLYIVDFDDEIIRYLTLSDVDIVARLIKDDFVDIIESQNDKTLDSNIEFQKLHEDFKDLTPVL